tara:strand:- start:562 stop:1227 length:666 start_codon:yes stop_codon:yes gene_type:complete
MSNKTIQLNEKLYEYLLSISLKEDEVLKSLRKTTAAMPGSRMQIAPDQGQFMAMLIKIMGAERLIEIGTYTGYSTLVCAMAMEKGQIITLDCDPVSTVVAKDYWKIAGVDHLIDLRLGDALVSLNQIIDDQDGLSSFDFIFIDADKRNYKNYYEIGLKLLRHHGIIIFDNVLWGGAVADLKDQNQNTVAIRELNEMLYKDSRIELSMIPVGDGLTIIRKKE